MKNANSINVQRTDVILMLLRNSVLLSVFIVGATSNSLVIEAFNYGGSGSDCPRCLYYNEDTVVFNGYAQRPDSEGGIWYFSNVAIFIKAAGSSEWERFCDPDLRNCGPSTATCYCVEKLESDTRRNFKISFKAQLNYSQASIYAKWFPPVTINKDSTKSAEQLFPTIKQRLKETLHVNGTLMSFNSCDMAVYENSPTTIKFCVSNLAGSYALIVHFGEKQIKKVNNKSCVQTKHKIKKEEFKVKKKYVLTYQSPYENGRHVCPIILFTRTEKKDRCKSFNEYLDNVNVSLIINNNSYQLSNDDSCSPLLVSDTPFKASVCLKDVSRSSMVSVTLDNTGSSIQGQASPCFDFQYIPKNETFVPAYNITLTNVCGKSKTFTCTVGLVFRQLTNPTTEVANATAAVYLEDEPKNTLQTTILLTGFLFIFLFSILLCTLSVLALAKKRVEEEKFEGEGKKETDQVEEDDSRKTGLVGDSEAQDSSAESLESSVDPSTFTYGSDY